MGGESILMLVITLYLLVSMSKFNSSLSFCSLMNFLLIFVRVSLTVKHMNVRNGGKQPSMKDTVWMGQVQHHRGSRRG